MRPSGTIAASAISIPKYIQPIAIGAENMFCSQARVPITARAISELMTTRRLISGRRERAGMISARAPKAKIAIAK